MPIPQRVAIVGTGRLACALGRLLAERGEPVAAVGGRDRERALQAAAFIGPDVRARSIEETAAAADGLLIAVADRALPEVAARLAEAGAREGVALHTAGVLGPEALAPLAAAGLSCGALHPLQTIPSAEHGVRALPGVAFGVTADGAAAAWAERIVALLGGTVLRIPASARVAYHAAAALAANGIVALIDAGEELLARAQVPPERARAALAPLVRSSLENALESGPAAALTGPVARGDAVTVEAHLRALGGADEVLSEVYRSVTRRQLALAARRGLSAERRRDMLRLLDPDGGTDV